jgi:hypothetical protein
MEPVNQISPANARVFAGVQVHPELYFAKLVALGEGDSEQIIL